MTVTGTLRVRAGEEEKTYEWNGDLNDRAVARSAFERLAATGNYLMVAYTAPSKGRQVSSFSQVEEIERAQGTVTVEATTALVGG